MVETVEMENKKINLGYVLKANFTWYVDNLYVYIWEWGFWWTVRNKEKSLKVWLKKLDSVIYSEQLMWEKSLVIEFYGESRVLFWLC